MNNVAREKSSVANTVAKHAWQPKENNDGWRKRRGWWAALRPTRTLLLGVVLGVFAGICTIVFIYQLVFGYYVLAPGNTENVETARALGGGAIPVTFFALSVSASGFIIGYFATSRAWLQGLLCGLAAGITEQTIVALNYPPVVALELSAYVLTGTCFGMLGGWLGGREAERLAASEDTLYRAMREIGSAENPEAVARAISSLFSGSEPVGVALWLNAPEGNEVGAAEAVWQRDTWRSFSPTCLLEVANETALPASEFRAIRTRKLRRQARDEWEQQDLGSALTSPLLSSGGECSGLLFVGFAEAGRASRVSKAWRTKRRLLTAAAGAAMALEKEKSGRMLGVLHERQRVSREIHDTLLQYFITVGGELATARLAAENGAYTIMSTHFERAHEGVRRGLEETRRLMREMRPEVLDGSSLPEVLATLTRRAAAESQIRATWEIRGAVRPLAPEVEHTLTRITEEALANIRRHSQASQVHASLEFRSTGVTLTISDDGVGLDSSSEIVRKEGGGFGMRSMMERASIIGGRLQIESSKGKGTMIVVDIASNVGRA
jgi:signal transduction histidine kinase